MNTYLTRWLVVCIALCSLGLSYTVQDLMDPTFQPYEDRDINMWERARLIDELKAQEAAQDSEEPASNEATLSPTEAAAIEAKIARDLKQAEMLKAKLAEQKALEDSKGPELGIPFEEYQENLNTEIQDVYPTKEPSDYDSINIEEPCSPEYGCGERAKAAWEAKIAAEEAGLSDTKEMILPPMQSPMPANSSGSRNCNSGELAVTLSLVDSYGDSWNGGFITFDGVDYTVSSTDNGGASASYDLCLVPGSYSYSYTVGSYGYENSWSFVDPSGPYTLSEGTGSAGSQTDLTFVVECTDVTLSLVDSYGDSWNGGLITFDGVDYTVSSTDNGGNSADYSFCLLDGDYSYSYTAGSYPGENSWSWNANGAAIASGSGTAGSQADLTFSLGGVPGCTDATACNYDSAATADNGSCIFSGECACPITDSQDATAVYYGFTAFHQICGDDSHSFGSTVSWSTDPTISYARVAAYADCESGSVLYASLSTNPTYELNGSGDCITWAGYDYYGYASGSEIFSATLTANTDPAQDCVDGGGVWDSADESCSTPGDSCSNAIEGAGAGTLTSWHAIELESGLLSATFDICDAGCDTKLAIYENCDDASYTWYNDDSYSICGSSASAIVIDAPAAGTYYVKAYPYSSCSNDYTLNVTTVEGIYGCGDPAADNYSDLVNMPCTDGDDDDNNPDCCEYAVATGCTDVAACNYDANAVQDSGDCVLPGDSFDCPAPLGDGVSGTADDFGGYYGFTVPSEGTVLNVEVSSCGSTFDTRLYVYAADDATGYLAYNDDGCSGSDLGGSSAASRIVADASDLPAGDYVVVLTPYSSLTTVADWQLAVSVNLEVVGCTDQFADNYDPTANVSCDDDCCTYSQVYGCMDATACNYDADATASNDSCEYAGDTCACPSTDGVSSTTGYYSFGEFVQSCASADGFGAVVTWTQADGDQDIHIMASSDCVSNDLIDLVGYPDYSSRTDNASVSLDAGECFTWQAYDWYGYSYSGTDVSAVVSENPDPSLVGGCTDSDASNYDADVDYDDGSCIYPGATCADAASLTLPLVDFTGTTSGFGDDYSTSPCSSSYISGDDYVGVFTLAEDSFLSGSITAVGSYQYPAVHITAECIDVAATCLQIAGGSNGGSFDPTFFAAGTYYATVSNYASPQNIDFTLNLTAAPVVVGCTDATATNYNADANTSCDDADADGVLDCCEYPADCTDYTVRMGDVYGDGWNGGAITIGSITFDGPASGCESDCTGSFDYGVCSNPDGSGEECWREETVCLEDGIYEVSVGGSSYNSEMEWEILDESGALVLSGGSPATACLDASEDSDCPTYGCTLAAAPNYDADADIDDGSCSYFPGGNYGYWASGSSWSGVPYDQCWLDCSTAYYTCDCIDDLGASTDCGTDEDGNYLGDGVPAALGDGVCDGADGGADFFCSELNWDSSDTSCDCGSQTSESDEACYTPPVFGCTDELANNTDPNANTDCTDPATQDDCVPCDYSCQDNAFKVRMGDSYGDTWNGGTITIGDIVLTGPPSGCEHIPEAGEEECWEAVDICLVDGLYDVSVGGSSYNSEMAWEIIDINEDSFNFNSVVLSGGSPYTGTLLAPVPEYSCGDGVCNDASYTDMDGNPGSESCGLAADADACNIDCGLCVWADQDAPVLSSYGTYYTTQDANGEDVTYPAIQWSWDAVDEGNTCADIIADPSLDACYTLTLTGYACDYLEEVNYDCSLVTECGLCWQPDACSEAGGNSSWAGDGMCDVSNNIEACGYDAGDCCCQTCDTTGFTNYDPNTCGSDLGNAPGYICVDPSVTEDTECACLAADDNAANDCEADPAQVCADLGGFYCSAGSASWVANDCITNPLWLCDGGADCSDGADETYISEGGSCEDPPDLGSCLHDYTASGSLTCDTAATDFGYSCSALASGFGWDCAGCECPLDDPVLDGCVYSGTDPQVGGMSCDEAAVAYGLGCETLHNSYSWNCTGCECPLDADTVASNGGELDEIMPEVSFEIIPISDDINSYNSFDENMMIISKVYGFENRPTSGPNPHYPNETWTDLAMKKIRVASLNNMPTPSILNLETGEVIPGDSNGNREVTYTFNYDYNGSTSDDYVLTQTQFLVYGFSDLAEACGHVRAANSAGEITAWADSCNQAGYSDYEDCNGDLISESELTTSLGDGVCDANFSCDTYDCDDGDCVDACGVCNGPGAIYDCGCSDYITCDDGTSVCDEADCPTGCTAGDLNADDSVDVLDVVALVSVVLAGGYDECGDMNGDGSTDVLDVVAQVAVVLGGSARSDDATSATMSVAGNTLNISGNGFISAVQMTLTHGSDFSISLTDDAMVADYATNDNMTTLIVVVPGSEEIFTASGDYDVAEVIVANSSSMIDVIEPSSFTLEAAYPNPFNPSTSLNLNMPVEGYVSVKAYNLVGQVVGVIAEGSMDAGVHTMSWDASSLSSGVYLITAEYAGQVATQKVMLMK